MSISLLLDEMKRSVERVRAEHGDAAAEKYEREQSYGIMGGHIKGVSGALTGAAIGSAILPGIGTVIGGAIGLLGGIASGVNDKTPVDNLKSLAGIVKKINNQ